ncbi:MAG: TRAP transporter small permease subunit [Gammaproteobacteria bacterium]|nr:TRAP transporter small permease subunit [Gammaproteobacteria bacterium]
MHRINTSIVARSLAYMMVSGVFLYLFNNYLVYWQELPGTFDLFSHYGYFGLEPLSNQLNDHQIFQAWTQLIVYLMTLSLGVAYSALTPDRSMEDDSIRFAQLAAYIIRFSFWWVFLVGFADMVISFLRVENFLEFWVGETLTQQLGRPIFRGTYVHYPLIVLSLVIAFRFKNVNFSWLALMVVLSEFLIVITRFVFSYEQAYMGDLVRFWYAALFLFASAHTLVEEGHVRVDVLYAGFGRRKKAWFDSIGSAFFGIPLCWVILMQGMGGRGNSINSPLLSFEVSQSGYGMYVKYLMAAFLIVYSVSMMIQFVSYLLFNISQLSGSKNIEDQPSYKELVNAEKVS